MKAAKPDQILDEKCPKCESNLVIKQGRFGEFTACTNYPNCKYVKMKSTGVVCPKDGGDIVERKSRRGKAFYGCANYPGLRFHAVEASDRRKRAPSAARRSCSRRSRRRPGASSSAARKTAPTSAMRRWKKSRYPPEARARSTDPRTGAQTMIHVIGGGLAGCEAAWQAASRGVPVTIHEMRPSRPTEVHKTDRLAELVCSNSFRGDKLDNAVGLLKEEMRRLDSLVMHAAEIARVPGGRRAGGRSRAVRAHRDAGDPRASAHHPRRARRSRRSLPATTELPVIIATGPLTSPDLSAAIVQLVGNEHLYFYDAISPIVLAETIDMSKVSSAPRGGIGAVDDVRDWGFESRQWRAGWPDVRDGRWRRRLPELSDDAGRVSARFTRR